MTGQHKALGFLGFFLLLSRKIKFPLGVEFCFKNLGSKFLLLNNRKKVKNPKSECWLASAFSQRDKRCLDCRFWSGACRKGRRNVIAVSEACELFEPKGSGFSIVTNIGADNAHNVNIMTKGDNCA